MRIELQKIDKSFFAVPVLKGVDFTVNSGEVHALLGENGAGKTTLMNILFGLYQADAGRILLDDEEITIKNPADAYAHGIGMVHQHFQLVDTLSASHNITLGLMTDGYPFSRRAQMNARIRQLATDYGLAVEPTKLIREMSVGEQQRVEIMKQLYREVDILILDEPTAVLTPQETEDFFQVLRELKASGKGIVIITHKIKEVQSICDVVTVLRDGDRVLHDKLSKLTAADLSQAMIGRQFERKARRCRKIPDTVLLSLSAVTVAQKGVLRLDNLSLDLRPGEILGVAGVDGNGQLELAESIMGIRKIQGGNITFQGRNLAHDSIRRRMRQGLGYIPADRHRDAVLMPFDLTDNLLLRRRTDPDLCRHQLLDKKAILKRTEDLIERFGVKTPSAKTPIRYLSGGNQQKFVLARELRSDLKLLIAFQPSRGLDIGATEYIREQLLALADQGIAVLLISTDLKEIMDLSDRIAVLYRGRTMGVLENNKDLQPATLGHLMAGGQYEEIK